jgi:hypothetical protein
MPSRSRWRRAGNAITRSAQRRKRSASGVLAFVRWAISASSLKCG